MMWEMDEVTWQVCGDKAIVNIAYMDSKDWACDEHDNDYKQGYEAGREDAIDGTRRPMPDCDTYLKGYETGWQEHLGLGDNDDGLLDDDD